LSGGWIKWEKDLTNDPRVLRMASRLSNAGVTPLSQRKLTVLGGLSVFWSFADTHIRDDDTIECAVNEINEVVGIANFCDLLPADWFEVLDPYRVHLPDFLKHSGIEAKKKALAAKRQERYRRNHNARVTPESRKSNAASVTNASPDQDQDQDLNKRQSKQRRAARIPPDFGLTDERKAFAIKHRLDPTATLEKFRDYWTAAARGTKLDWDATWRTWCRTEAERRPKTNGHHPSPSNDVAAWAEAKALAKSIGFREPFMHETATAYMTSIRLAAAQPVMAPLAERIGRSGVKRIAP
jgi:hypothetical protein